MLTEDSTPHFLNYATLASPVVCATADPSGKGRCGRRLYAAGAGTAVLRPRGAVGAGSDRTITLVAGGNFLGEFDQVVSGTATNVVVFWGR